MTDSELMEKYKAAVENGDKIMAELKTAVEKVVELQRELNFTTAELGVCRNEHEREKWLRIYLHDALIEQLKENARLELELDGKAARAAEA